VLLSIVIVVSAAAPVVVVSAALCGRCCEVSVAFAVLAVALFTARW
jgi:hypothetical protein